MSRLAYSNRYWQFSKNNTEAPRITGDKMLTLRAKSAQEDSSRKVLGSLMVEVQNFMAGFLFVPPAKPNSMCKYYGHVIKGSWKRDLPNCADCGTLIKCPSDLRTAAARQ